MKLKWIIVWLIILSVAIQWLPTKTNVQSKDAYMLSIKMPNAVHTILQNACADCHSNFTKYPWYAAIQPFKYFVNKHIQDGKEAFNFHEFDQYSNRKQQSKLKSMLSQIQEDEMPLASYQLFHSNARLTTEQKQLLENWITEIIEKNYSKKK